MQRQRWNDHRSYSEVFLPATKFQPGDVVHAVDGGEVGTVEFARHDGRCCIK
jgi:hypothetical protein